MKTIHTFSALVAFSILLAMFACSDSFSSKKQSFKGQNTVQSVETETKSEAKKQSEPPAEESTTSTASEEPELVDEPAAVSGAFLTVEICDGTLLVCTRAMQNHTDPSGLDQLGCGFYAKCNKSPITDCNKVSAARFVSDLQKVSFLDLAKNTIPAISQEISDDPAVDWPIIISIEEGKKADVRAVEISGLFNCM